LSGPTTAFSCGARSAFKLKEKRHLRTMLSRRQLQGFVGLRLAEALHLMESNRCLPAQVDFF
jgi:hypothetical protein